MKLLLMPREWTWWVWLITVVLLAIGLAGHPPGFIAAVVLSFAQTLFLAARHDSVRAFPVQIRVAYTVLLAGCYLPGLRWLYWLPTLGTVALLLFGYCLMARILSLLPWNRSRPVSGDLIRRTFLTAPVAGNPWQGLPASACPGGVCTLEARIADYDRCQ